MSHFIQRFFSIKRLATPIIAKLFRKKNFIFFRFSSERIRRSKERDHVRTEQSDEGGHKPEHSKPGEDQLLRRLFQKVRPFYKGRYFENVLALMILM